jgi:CO dehydrogenase nickel-insertion accessory protein CooC1
MASAMMRRGRALSPACASGDSAIMGEGRSHWRCVAAIGERVLIIDLDPQGNASTGLGIDRRQRRLSTALLVGKRDDAQGPRAVAGLRLGRFRDHGRRPLTLAIGERVLIIDLDPQGNASTGLGIDRRQRRLSTYDSGWQAR